MLEWVYLRVCMYACMSNQLSLSSTACVAVVSFICGCPEPPTSRPLRHTGCGTPLAHARSHRCSIELPGCTACTARCCQRFWCAPIFHPTLLPWQACRMHSQEAIPKQQQLANSGPPLLVHFVDALLQV